MQETTAAAALSGVMACPYISTESAFNRHACDDQLSK